MVRKETTRDGAGPGRTMLRKLLSSTATLSSLVLAVPATNNTGRNDGIHLAIGPTCGKLTSTGDTSDLNAGLWDLNFTAGGVRDGSPLAPAVITPPSPKAGGRTTNGPVAHLDQSNKLDPLTTLYTVYFGINDVSASHTDGAENLPAAAQAVLDQIKRLSAPPTNARSFLVTDSYGRGKREPAGEAYKKNIFNGLAKLHHGLPFLQIGYADFGYIWDAVLNTSPGYAAFGYNSPGACALNSSTIIGACDDPDHTFYWIPGVLRDAQAMHTIADFPFQNGPGTMVISLSKLYLVTLLFAPGSRAERNDGIKLVIGPTCGKLTPTGNVTDVNSGLLDIKNYKTIVSFGDSYTAGGVRDGSPLAPPVITPPSPKAGGRTTNGPVWIENIANDVGARFMDYAVAGAVTDKTLWPSKASSWDFVQEADIFLSQNNSLDPSTTLYTVYFGINDVSGSRKDGPANLPRAAQVILDKIELLSRPPTNARSFLLTDSYGYGSHEAPGDAFKKKVFNGIAEMKTRVPSLKFAFVGKGELKNRNPGYAAFGYTSIGSCTLNSSTIDGAVSTHSTYDNTIY
ncbi:GDSL-like lipase/Acylhydrolase domain-containing protein [Rhizoctonia solani AG-1 IA]|uniref:GDSL-like lipase/Acylhydrolase domain-containing protein n=1 Tax=Thanatephorus cucumeris (strain AG1-IA) TaxID=983506 RepID=L8WL35_THACA|nr:GDSL-like lipase/Acylhydrolase domain-containing protein [Rhizoctonia solani AG-1 IA]